MVHHEDLAWHRRNQMEKVFNTKDTKFGVWIIRTLRELNFLISR